MYHVLESKKDSKSETYLVDIHVALGPRTGLEHDKWEVVNQFARYYLPCRIR